MVRPSRPSDYDNCMLIKQGELKSLYPGMKYLLYEHQDGGVHGETLCATFDIANNRRGTYGPKM